MIPLDLTYDTTYLIESVPQWQGELVAAGSQLYTEYAIPTLLLGMGLILSIVGAIAITR
jgi:NADH:ubiquinone oxidoreductase subunit 6 (subunit J)